MNMAEVLKTASVYCLEIIEALKKFGLKKTYCLYVLSATEWTEGGWTADDSVALAKILKNKGVDLIDCSTGGNIAKC
jgi:2,4-dienoyl-CoA reductase-like NADH-dependent reductase (Old Yellow Enzyme family)